MGVSVTRGPTKIHLGKLAYISLLVFVISFGLVVPAFAGTITVNNTVTCDSGSGHPPYSTIYCNIQDAIDDAAAGDTVNVMSGTYDEQLVIDTRITLIGSDSATIVRPSASPVPGEYDVEINASGTTIDNLIFDFNGGTGLVDGSRGGQFTGFVVSDLNGPDVTGVTISNNTIYTGEVGTGIQTGKNADVGGLVIDGNTFYGDADGLGEGVYVNPQDAASSGVTISGNTFLGNLFSAVSIESSDVVVTDNTINSDLTKGLYGVRFYDYTGGETYSGVQIGGPNPADANSIENFTYGIRVGTSTDVSSSLTTTIQGNTLTGNDYGLWGRYGAVATVSSNTFTSNVTQVWDAGGTLDLEAIFFDNTFDYSAWAFSGSWIFTSIQDAIDDASPGDVVRVGDGTYVEDLMIPDTLPGLWLRGEGVGSTTIKGVSNVAAGLFPLAVPNIDVLASGVTIDGFTIQGPNPVVGYYSSGVVVGGDDLEMYDNAFQVPNAASFDDISQGLQTYRDANNPTGGDVDGLNIHDNTFTDFGAGTYGFEGIFINHTLSDPTPGAVTIADNIFSGDVIRAITTERSNVSITGNTIDTDLPPSPADFTVPFAYQGINVQDYDDRAQQVVSVTGNMVNGFWQQVADPNGALALASVFAANTFDLSAYAESGTAIFSSIQDAIDVASAGDTVHVGAGIYVEDLVIPEALTGLELSGAGSSSIIKGVDQVAAASWPLADPNIEVLADDVSLHGFTIRGPDPAAGFYSSGIVVGGANFEVYNNAFEVPNAGSLDDISQGLQTYAASTNPTSGGEVDGLNIHDNTFTDLGAGTWGYEGIYVNTDAGDPAPGGAVTIHNNSFAGDIVRAITTERSNATITNNWIDSDLAPSDLSTAGAWQGVNVDATQDITFTGNTVNGFYQQVDDDGGSLVFADVVANNTFDKSASADSLAVIFSSVQDAIDDASTDDTVNVGAGTYVEDLVIPDTHTSLELVGAGSSNTTIKGVANVPAASFPIADPNIEILAAGAEIHGFTIQGPDPVAGYYSSGLLIGADGVEVYNNAFQVPNAAGFDDISQAIQTYRDVVGMVADDLSIHDNTFTDFGAGTYGYEGIFINHASTDPTPAGYVNIEDNTFTGDVIRAITTERSNVAITGNTIATDLPPSPADFSVPFGYQGINVQDYSSRAQQDVAVTGNTVGGSGSGLGFDQGIRVGRSVTQDLKYITISSNTFIGDNTYNVRYYRSDITDFDGDGQTDPAKFDSSTNTLSYLESSTDTWQDVDMGAGTYDYVPRSDFDGDGLTDPAKFIPASGALWYLESSTGTWQGVYMGPGSYSIVSGSDFDGDGKTDPAQFSDSLNALWYLESSTSTWQGIYTGPGTYSMVSGSDFDGDGKTDPAQFSDSSNALWYLESSSSTWQGMYTGPGTYQMVPASDFDGDGKTDPAHFSDAVDVLWYLESTTTTWQGVYIGAGANTYVPAADFDRDLKTDPAKFVPSTGMLWWLESSTSTWDGVYLGSGTYEVVN